MVLDRPEIPKWNWVQPNGALKDGICRSLMLKLHREGHIKLPPRKQPFTGGYQAKQKIKKYNIDQTPIFSTVKKIQPIEIRQVRRTKLDKFFNSLIDQYHYLKYTQPVGEHLKNIVFAMDRPIACFTFSSAPYRILLRDNFIGWSFEMLEKNRHFLAYNSRFLILPWVHVPNLASHLLENAHEVFHKIGKHFINILFFGWRLLSILIYSKVFAIQQLIGNFSEMLLAVVNITKHKNN